MSTGTIDRIAATAEAIAAARRARQVSQPLDSAIAPRDEAEGYAAQLALARLQGAVPPAGFKIGATAKGMQEYLGVSGPMAGFMPGPLHRDGAQLRYGSFVRPGVECEIAFRLARDIPPGAIDRATAAAAVAACLPAIEIVENRYADFKQFGVPALISDQVFHAGAVLGPDAYPDVMTLDGLEGRISLDGKELGRGMGAALLGHPLEVLRWLANSGAAHAFGGLKAGQVVLCGSVTPPFWLDGPGRIEVDFGTLGRVSFTFA
jgi:2-keto-4-pentenoate hydratase